MAERNISELKDNIQILDSITIGRVNLDDIAVLYAGVFATPPWNEFVKCRDCGKFNGMEKVIGEPCECGGTLEEAYPIRETVDYILHEAENPGFRMAVFKSEDFVGGFSWSYLIDKNSLVRKKWTIAEDINGVKGILDQYFVDGGMFRYFSECGVSPNLRGLGLANKLTESVTGPEITVYRTNCFSPMMAVAEKNGFKQIMGPRVDIDRLSRKISMTECIIGRADIENPQRTLFIK